MGRTTITLDEYLDGTGISLCSVLVDVYVLQDKWNIRVPVSNRDITDVAFVQIVFHLYIQYPITETSDKMIRNQHRTGVGYLFPRYGLQLLLCTFTNTVMGGKADAVQVEFDIGVRHDTVGICRDGYGT